MIYYSFFLTRKKLENEKVYRTKQGWSDIKEHAEFFSTEAEAQSDLFKLMFDHEEFVFDSYWDTDSKAKRTAKSKPAVKFEPIYEPPPTDIVLERNKVYNLKAEHLMAIMPSNFVDITITSPPYNAGDRSGIGDLMYAEYDDNKSDDEYEQWLFLIIDELIRVTRKHVFFNIQMLANNKETVMKIFGMYHKNIKDVIIWNKKQAPPHIQPGIMNSKFEFIIVFSNDKPWLKKFDDAIWPQGSFNNVIEGVNASQNEFSKLNKATFPLYLPRTILTKFGAPGELIYDPFTGTGTTFEACVIEKRDFIGSELDAKQCDITNKRFKNSFAKSNTLDF